MLFKVIKKQAAMGHSGNAMNQAYLGYPVLGTYKQLELGPAKTYAFRRQLPSHPEVIITTQPPHK